jgi:hypothetical protein
VIGIHCTGIGTPRSEPALQAWATVRVQEHRVGPGWVDNALCTAVWVLAEDPERPAGEIIAVVDDIAAGRAAEEIADFEPTGLPLRGEKLLELADQMATAPFVCAAVLRHSREAEPGRVSERVAYWLPASRQ